MKHLHQEKKRREKGRRRRGAEGRGREGRGGSQGKIKGKRMKRRREKVHHLRPKTLSFLLCFIFFVYRKSSSIFKCPVSTTL